MALSTSNVKSTIVERYFTGLSSVLPDYKQTVDYRTTDAAALKIAGLTGLGVVPTWNGTASLNDSATEISEATNGVTLNYTQYGAQLTVSRANMADCPEAVGYAAQKLGFAVANTYAKLAFEAWSQGFAGTTVTGDGEPLFTDQHATAAGGSNYRSNAFTTALDASALMAARKLAREWIAWDGSPYDISAAGFWIICPPGLEEAAHQAVSSPYTLTTAGTSSQGQGLSNVSQAWFSPSDIVVSSHLTDDNNWIIVSKLESPLVMWERLAPEIRMTTDPDTLNTRITCDFALALGGHGDPSVAIGAVVS